MDELRIVLEPGEALSKLETAAAADPRLLVHRCDRPDD